jgi:hypothetical protein
MAQSHAPLRTLRSAVYRFGWHIDLWDAGTNKNASWHCACALVAHLVPKYSCSFFRRPPSPYLLNGDRADSDRVYDGGNYQDAGCEHQDLGDFEARDSRFRHGYLPSRFVCGPSLRCRDQSIRDQVAWKSQSSAIEKTPANLTNS